MDWLEDRAIDAAGIEDIIRKAMLGLRDSAARAGLAQNGIEPALLEDREGGFVRVSLPRREVTPVG